MKLILGFILSFSCFAENAVRLEIGESVLNNLPEISIEQNEPIDQKTPLGHVTGVAYTTGSIALKFIDDTTQAHFKLVADVKVRAEMTTAKRPKKKLQVFVYSTAHTNAQLVQEYAFTKEGLKALTSAETTAGTSLMLNNVKVTGTAGELRKSLAASMAGMVFKLTKSIQESEINHQVMTRINDMVEKKGGAKLEEFNRDYRQLFYQPFLEIGIAQKMNFSTTENAIRVSMFPPTEISVPDLPPKLFGAPFRLSMHTTMVSSLGTKFSAGKLFNEKFFARLLGIVGIGSHAVADAIDDDAEQLYFRFCAVNPMVFDAHGDELVGDFCFSSLTWKGQEFGQVKFTVPFRIYIHKGLVVVERLTDSPNSVPEIHESLLSRFVKIIPRRIPFGSFLRSGVIGGGKASLELTELTVENGWIQATWEKP